jgi:hypothetical protein
MIVNKTNNLLSIKKEPEELKLNSPPYYRECLIMLPNTTSKLNMKFNDFSF